jgi:anti-anti-sigma regulatory factor
MLKISQVEATARTVTLKLEGRVVGPWVGEMRKACETVLTEGVELILDLTDVSFADASGVSALSHLKSRGVSVLSCSPFVEEQLKSASQ